VNFVASLSRGLANFAKVIRRGIAMSLSITFIADPTNARLLKKLKDYPALKREALLHRSELV
jgi:hypothetical protein